jgi:glucose/arabinose dehydrogenase
MPAGLNLTSAFMSWNPQRRVSGILFYTGDKFSKWKGNMFLGTLNNQQIHRVAFTNDGPAVHEDLFTVKGLQVRDVRQGPDGLIYFTSFEESGPGRVLRIEPGY